MDLLGVGPLGAIVLGASCGLRIFVAPVVLCLLANLGRTPLDPPGWMASPWVAVGALALLLAELCGDKLPGVDPALDAAGLVLRPAWAAGIVLATVPGDTAPLACGLACAGALVLGLGKARLRFEAREGDGVVTGPVLSVIEDRLAGLAALAAVTVAPLGAVGLVLVALGLHLAARALHRRRWSAGAAA